MPYVVQYGDYVKTQSGINKYEVIVYADTPEDIPVASELPSAAVGSVCIVFEPFDVLFLNTEGVWKSV